MFDQMQDFVNDQPYDNGAVSDIPYPDLNPSYQSGEVNIGSSSNAADLSMSGMDTAQTFAPTGVRDEAAYNQALTDALKPFVAPAGSSNPVDAEKGLGGWIKDGIKEFKSLFKDDKGNTNGAMVMLAGSFLKGFMSYPQEKRANDIAEQRVRNETDMVNINQKNLANKSSMGKVNYKPGMIQFVNKRKTFLNGG